MREILSVKRMTTCFSKASQWCAALSPAPAKGYRRKCIKLQNIFLVLLCLTELVVPGLGVVSGLMDGSEANSAATTTTSTTSTTSRRIGRFVAYVGVRDGSDRCPRKNVRHFFHNKSLLDLKLEILQQVTQLKEIVVTSDSEEMLAVARWHNNNSPPSSPPIRAVARDPYFCSDDVHVAEYFEHIAVELEGVADHILYAPVTAPLLQVKDFNMLLESFVLGYI